MTADEIAKRAGFLLNAVKLNLIERLQETEVEFAAGDEGVAIKFGESSASLVHQPVPGDEDKNILTLNWDENVEVVTDPEEAARALVVLLLGDYASGTTVEFVDLLAEPGVPN